MKRLLPIALLLAGPVLADPFQTNTGTFQGVVSTVPDFGWTWNAQTDQRLDLNFGLDGISNVSFRLATAAQAYLTVTGGSISNTGVGAMRYVADISRTNLPPARIYQAEVIGYGSTNAGSLARVLAAGTVEILPSVFSLTNAAAWTSRVVALNLSITGSPPGSASFPYASSSVTLGNVTDIFSWRWINQSDQKITGTIAMGGITNLAFRLARGGKHWLTLQGGFFDGATYTTYAHRTNLPPAGVIYDAEFLAAEATNTAAGATIVVGRGTVEIIASVFAVTNPAPTSSVYVTYNINGDWVGGSTGTLLRIANTNLFGPYPMVGRTGIVVRVENGVIVFDNTGGVGGGGSTNVSSANLIANNGAGWTSATLLRGDWGLAISNDLAALLGVVSGLSSGEVPVYVEEDLLALAALSTATNALHAGITNALPKSGGRMSGDIDMGGTHSITNLNLIRTEGNIWDGGDLFVAGAIERAGHLVWDDGNLDPSRFVTNGGVSLNGAPLTNGSVLLVSANAVTNRGAWINGEPITNGAMFSVISTNITVTNIFNITQSVTNFTTITNITIVTNTFVAIGVSFLNNQTGAVTIAAGGLGLRVTTNNGVITVTNTLPIPQTNTGYALTLQFIPTNQTYNWQPIGVVADIPQSSVGTNLAIYDYIGRSWQSFTVPIGITQLEFYVWGGGGAGSGNSGASAGFTYMYCPVLPGTLFDLAVAEGGATAVPTTQTVMTNAFVGGGIRATNNVIAYAGGGASIVKISGTTNYYSVAAGGSAGIASTGTSGMGGGKDGGARMSPVSAETNITIGTHATADNYYGLNAAAGTNAYVTNGIAGSFLQAGLSYSAISNSAISMFCPGSGWFGGAGNMLFSTNGIAGAGSMHPGSGNSFINPNFGSGYTERGGPTYLYVGGMEYAWWGGTAGLGGANTRGQHGRIVVKY